MIINPPEQDIEQLFYANQLLYWPDFYKQIDYNYLSNLPIHENVRLKKFKSRELFKPIGRIEDHPLAVWASTVDEAKKIQNKLMETETYCYHLVKSWFPKTQLLKAMHSWRYTLTENEALHLDKYDPRIVKPVVRLFINLDTHNRLWDVGKQATRIEFPPGSAWMVNSEQVEHAIIYGRRALMLSWET